jgi:hypothetical protein
MSENAVALLSAFIGLAGTFTGALFALFVALKQVNKTARATRQESRWQARREGFAALIMRLQAFQRAVYDSQIEIHQSRPVDGLLEKTLQAADAVDLQRVVVELGEPHNSEARRVLGQIEPLIYMVHGTLEIWAKAARSNGSPLVSEQSDFERSWRDFETRMAEMKYICWSACQVDPN